MASKHVQSSFNDLMFRQIDGASMGSPLGPFLANIFLVTMKTVFFVKVKLSHWRITGSLMMFSLFFSSKNNVDNFHTALNG